MWFRIMAVAAAAVCLHAQNAPTDLFEKAPPDVDEALRARVAKFYQAHVDGKFRQAEQYVAEDSKDTFYNMQKPKFLKYEILKVNYEENFTKATVVVGVEMVWRSGRIGDMVVKPPVTSLWKIENGEWCWYVSDSKDWKTPYGNMTHGPASPKSAAAEFKGVDPSVVTGGVRIDHNEIKLSSYEKSSGGTTVTNSMPGQVQVAIGVPTVPGLTVTIDKKTLNSGEKAKVSFVYDPPDKNPKPTQMAKVLVQPTNQEIAIRLTFAVPPEALKNVPPEVQRQLSK
jgi:hypothetical protein